MTPTTSGMTSPTRPARCTTDRALPGSFRLAVLLSLLLPACGLLSRDEFLRRDLRSDRAPETLTRLRGVQPLNPNVWMFSAFVSGEGTAETALEIVDRGLRFHPSDPHLLYVHVELQGQIHGPQALVEAAHAVLGSGHPPEFEAELRLLVVIGELRLDHPDLAAEETVRMGALAAAHPKLMALVSASWARIALSYEFIGQSNKADDAIDNSLVLGSAGIGLIQLEVHSAPERIAAARNLMQRAAARHPRDPDVALFLAVDLLLQGDVEAAEQSLDNLPGPLPWRLRSSSTAVRARGRLKQERVSEALDLLAEWMDRYPRDSQAVAVLLEIWTRLGQPDDETMASRLEAARSRHHPPGLTAQIELTLQELRARAPDEAN